MSADEAATKLSRTFASAQTLKLARMHKLDLFHTPLEQRFERITRLARRLLNVRVAAVTILSNNKQWFKSVSGWTVSELPLEQSLCISTVAENRLIVIPDTTADPRFADHPLVIGDPKFKFYAGYPLRDQDGVTGATFCVFDVEPRELSSEDVQSLRDLGQMAQQELLADRLSDAQTELISKLSSSRREAMLDPLTRVWNRRGTLPFLRMALVDDQNFNVSVALVDLDNFKQINDTYGHQAGDDVLREVANRLVSCLKAQDIVCRYGGDEFLLLLVDADGTQAARIAERARRTISESPIETEQGPVRATISIGCAARAEGDKATAEALIGRADDALMKGKSDGRDRVSVFTGGEDDAEETHGSRPDDPTVEEEVLDEEFNPTARVVLADTHEDHSTVENPASGVSADEEEESVWEGRAEKSGTDADGTLDYLKALDNDTLGIEESDSDEIGGYASSEESEEMKLLLLDTRIELETILVIPDLDEDEI